MRDPDQELALNATIRPASSLRARAARRSILALAVLLAGALAGGSASAKPKAAKTAKTPRTEDRERAKIHFASGSAHYRAGAFAKAIPEFDAAYQLAPLPEILYNLGQAHRQLGNEREALAFYRRFLDAGATGQPADEAREHIVELTGTLEKERAERKRVEKERLDQERAEQERLEKERLAPSMKPMVEPAPAAESVALAPTDAPPPAEAKPIYKRWWLWTIVGGVAVAGAAVGLGVALAPGPSAPEVETSLGTLRPF